MSGAWGRSVWCGEGEAEGEGLMTAKRGFGTVGRTVWSVFVLHGYLPFLLGLRNFKVFVLVLLLVPAWHETRLVLFCSVLYLDYLGLRV